MALVITIRDYPPNIPLPLIKQDIENNQGCFDSWKMQWQYSFRDSRGHTVCFFNAPDADSVRMGIHQGGWNGPAIVKTVERMQGANSLSPTVAVERHFDEPVTFEEMQAREEPQKWCLMQYQVKHIESYLSLDKKTLICFYHAPDAESVRSAQRQTGLPFDKVWACEKIDEALLRG